MKKLGAIFFLSIAAVGGATEDVQKVRNEIRLQLAKERLKLIKTDGDLKSIFDNIIRTHEKLERVLQRHPQLIKNGSIKEPALTNLKLQLMRTDEDLRDLSDSLVKLSRKLEKELRKNQTILHLTERLSSIETNLEKLRQTEKK